MRRLSVQHWLRHPLFWQCIVAASWVVVLFVAFRPGLMSGDTLDQLAQGLNGTYTNQHPPLLSWALGRCVGVFGTPAPIFLLQLVALAGGLVALMRRASFASVALLAVFLWVPPVWATSIAIWKDVATAATLLLAVAALIHRRGAVAIVLLILASVMRHNALLASVPLFVPAVLCVPWLRARRAVAALAIAACVAATAVAPKIVDRAYRAQDVFTLAWVLGYDLAGVYAERPDLLPGSLMSEQVSIDDLRANYNAESSAYLFFWPKTGTHAVAMQPLIDRRDELKRDWWRALREAPGTFLRIKLERFGNLLGLHERNVHYPFHAQIDPNPYGFQLHANTMVFRGLSAVRDAVANSFLFRGWFWFLLALVAGVLAFVRRRVQPLAVWVSASGLAYGFGYLLVGPASDFRYLFWMIVSVFASCALMLPERAVAPAASSSAATGVSEPAPAAPAPPAPAA